MQELKPCPFCGGPVSIGRMLDGDVSVVCDHCGLNARFGFFIGEEGLRVLWNARAERKVVG